MRALTGEEWQWAYLSNHLLALLGDELAWSNWTKTKDGQHNRRRPDPIPRPGVKRRVKRDQPQMVDTGELDRLLAATRTTTT